MPMRIAGLGSGFDIDKLVSDLMNAERIPLDKMKQKQQYLLWKESAYRDFNAKFASFRDSLNNLRFTGGWASTKVSSSNSSAVSVSSSSTATPTTHTISVSKLASGAATSSSAPISNASLVGTAITSPVTIDSTNNQINVTLNGATKTVTLTANTYNTAADLQTELQNQLNNAFGANQINVGLNGSGQLSLTPGGTGNLPQLIVGSVSGNTNGLTALGFTDQQSYKIDANAALSSSGSKLAAGAPTLTGSFTVNGIQITYDGSTDSLTSIMNKVNSSAAGVNMSYDSISDKVIVTTKGTGSAAQIQITDNTGSDLISKLNLTTATAITGKDASLTIDNVGTTRSTNTFTMDGVTYTLNATTTTDVTVSVGRDTDAIFNKVKDFVTTYNSVIDMVNQKMNEPKYRDYQPLTDEQKTAMKDSDITLWESKAKSGLLQNDSTIKSAASSLRSLVSQTVQGISTSYNALYKIGITTYGYPYAQNDAGKLQIDENKLRDAIAQDPDGVISLFANQPAGTNPPANEKGIAQAMYDQMNTSIKQLISVAGGVNGLTDDISTSLGLQIHTLSLDISDFNVRLSSKEDYYYQQFTAMDTAIQNSNAQISWLASQG